MPIGCTVCALIMCVMYCQGYRVARPGEEMCRKGCPTEEQLEMVLVSMKPRLKDATVQNLRDVVVAFTVMNPERDVEELQAYLSRIQFNRMPTE